MIDETVYCVQKKSPWLPSKNGDGSQYIVISLKNIDTNKTKSGFLDDRFLEYQKWANIDKGDLVKNLPPIVAKSGRSDRVNLNNVILVQKKKSDPVKTQLTFESEEKPKQSERKHSSECKQCPILSNALSKHLNETHQLNLFNTAPF